MDGLTEGARIAVGSLPTLDAMAAVKAQIQGFPEVPAWPQLPKKSSKERMNLQGLSGLPGLNWGSPEQPLLTLSPRGMKEALELMTEENRRHYLERAAFQPDEATGFYAFLQESERLQKSNILAVKGQLIGPLSWGLLVKDDEGKPLVVSREAMKLLVQYVLLHARWQLEKLSVLGKPVVLFLDEPFLSRNFEPKNYGIRWKDIREWHSCVIEGLQEEGALVGLHCCGPGPWPWAFETTAEFFHFDASQYMDHLLEDAENLKKYLRKGGNIVWGIVPTGMVQGQFADPAELYNRWEDTVELLSKKGMEMGELTGRSFFSTACGLGASSVSVTEDAMRCLGAFVALWKANRFQE